MHKLLKFGFIAFILISLGVFIALTDISEVWLQMKDISIGFVWILLVSFMAYLTGAMAWKYCFRNEKIPLLKLLYTRTVGELITLFNPSNIIAGEAFKHHSLKSDIKDKSELLDSILISRIVMIISQLSLLYICTLILLCTFLGYFIATIFLVATLAIGLLTGYILSKVNSAWLIKSYLFRHQKIQSLIIKLKEIRYRLIKQFTENPAAISKAFLWSTVHWLLGALEIYVILILLHHAVSFLNCITVDMGVVFLKSLGGMVPGQLGIEEFSNKLMLELIGLTQAGLWLSVSLIRRAKQLFWIAIAGLAYFLTNISSNNKRIRYGKTVCNT